MKNQVRGVQTETISDYKIEGRMGEKVVHESHVKNNYLRKVVHQIPKTKVNSVRIVVQKTHGDKFAKIFEIRCYQ
ncbi:hypothetical protein D3C72_2455420 [compost metagenome]